jgi:glucoamylase
VQQYLWTGDQSQHNGGAIKFDLDWVAENWAAAGCDLWEEVQSDDFFWNRYTMRYGLTMGATLAQAMGDDASASTYRSAASAINATLGAHYNGQYVYESTNRQEDSAVLLAFTHGYLNDGVFAPDSQEVAGTLLTLAELFHGMFYINQQDDKQAVPGVLFGRYQGDSYGAGGAGPWLLTTGVAAQAVYDAGLSVLEKNVLPSNAALNVWGRLFEVSTLPSTPAEFASAALTAGDGILMRLRSHVDSPAINFRLSEQFDPTTGAEQSAQSLTWSYSQVLLACHHRDMLVTAQ